MKTFLKFPLQCQDVSNTLDSKNTTYRNQEDIMSLSTYYLLKYKIVHRILLIMVLTISDKESVHGFSTLRC